MRIDVMVDLETLGTKSNSTIFQIAAVGFDITTGEIGSEFNKVADLSKNETYDMQVEGSTLKWWLSTPEKVTVLSNLMAQGIGSSDELLANFRKWLQGLGAIGDVYLWGNGINFDNRLLLEQMGDAYPINFRRERDVRTIADLACERLETTEKQLRTQLYDNSPAHNALNDVRNQVKLVHACHSVLMKDNHVLVKN